MRQRSPRRRRVRAQRLSHRWWDRGAWRLLPLVLPAALCAMVGAVYVYVQFSQMIILGFEGKRWSLSSKVYAEPESLYPGLPLRLDEPSVVCDVVCAAALEDIAARQAALEEPDVCARLEKACQALATLLLKSLPPEKARMH